MSIVVTDSEAIRDFVRRVEEISGENFSKCMQCGTCSGTCPMIHEMGFGPRKTILLAKFGLQEQIATDNTAWICASCHSCMVRCPRGIDVAKLMEAVRQIMLRTNRDYIEPFALDDDLIKTAPQIALVSCFRKHTA